MSFVNLVLPPAAAAAVCAPEFTQILLLSQTFFRRGVILVIRGFKPILFFGRNFKKPAG